VFNAHLALGYEGTMYKWGGYQPGRNWHIVKRKGWRDDDFEVTRLIRGNAGKYENSLGAIECRTASCLLFEVGGFMFDDGERQAVWEMPGPWRAKISDLALTDDGRPYNTTCLGVWQV